MCVCVFTCDIQRLALSDGGNGAPRSLQGVPCLPAGVCSRQTEGCLCTPARKLLLTLTQTHRQTRNTPPHPAELRDGGGCCGGWGFGGVGTLCSSRTPLMHNSCASIQVAILIFHKAFKINRISQCSAFSHTVLQEITLKSCSLHQESNEMLQKLRLSGRHCWSDAYQWRRG